MGLYTNFLAGDGVYTVPAKNGLPKGKKRGFKKNFHFAFAAKNWGGGGIDQGTPGIAVYQTNTIAG